MPPLLSEYPSEVRWDKVPHPQEYLREKWRHEDELFSRRVGWALLAQPLLYVGLIPLARKAPETVLREAPLIGVVVTAGFAGSMIASGLAQREIKATAERWRLETGWRMAPPDVTGKMFGFGWWASFVPVAVLILLWFTLWFDDSWLKIVDDDQNISHWFQAWMEGIAGG